MEYLNFRGEYLDVPIAEIEATFRSEYAPLASRIEADFDRDVARETSGD